ncbi:unnamed protein product [Lampetra planeri]
MRGDPGCSEMGDECNRLGGATLKSVRGNGTHLTEEQSGGAAALSKTGKGDTGRLREPSVVFSLQFIAAIRVRCLQVDRRVPRGYRDARQLPHRLVEGRTSASSVVRRSGRRNDQREFCEKATPRITQLSSV